jgi:hypothetical protein
VAAAEMRSHRYLLQCDFKKNACYTTLSFFCTMLLFITKPPFVAIYYGVDKCIIEKMHARKISLLHSVKPDVIVTVLAYASVCERIHKNYTKHFLLLNIIIVHFWLYVIPKLINHDTGQLEKFKQQLILQTESKGQSAILMRMIHIYCSYLLCKFCVSTSLRV